MIYTDPRWEGISGIGRYAERITAGLGLRRLPLHGRAGTPWAPIQISASLRRQSDATSFLSLGFTSPISASIPYSIFIYGLMQREPGLGFPRYYQAYYDTVVRRGARRANSIFTISEISADAIRSWLHDADAPIVNVGAGVEPHFRVISNTDESPHPASVLYVGSMNPNKGFDRLASAFAGVEDRSVKLVVVTRAPDDAGAILSDAGVGNERFRLHTDIDDDALVRLYNTCRATVVPSRSEGFGLPVIEAGACGSPVICSDLAVFREVARGGVEHFDSVDHLSELLTQAVATEPLSDAERLATSARYVDAYRWGAVVDKVRMALAANEVA